MPFAQKKTLKVKSETKPTQVELKKAYQLVTNDLFNKLVKAKDKEKITIGTLGSLGSFHKSERRVKSGIVPKGTKMKKTCRCLTTNQVKTKPDGTYVYCSPTCSLKKSLSTYVYFNVRFKPSKGLKAELNKPLVKKYSK
jgi:nucleoid DNA-binding protein